MTVGINSLLNTGKGALLAFQAAMHVTGENIANVNTPGYSRRSVRLEENISIDYRPGQIGTGVKAAEVLRHFDYFIERQYLDKSASRERWDAMYTNLRNVELLFNESIGDGLNSAMADFWADWQNLSLRPDDMASRSQLMSTAHNLTQIITQVDRDLTLFQQQMDDFIRQDVDRANELMEQIAELNRQIRVHDIPGQNNANATYDERDSLLRELAEIIDIQTQDKGGGQLLVITKAGHTLVDGNTHFELKVDGPKSYASLTSGSAFDGEIKFSGSSEREYLVEIITDGAIGAATFKVSLDGGKTWLKDEDGNVKSFTTQLEANKINIEGVDIWFEPGLVPGDLADGDKFTIVPKTGLYWYENTSSEMNITPQIYFNGDDNERRAVGGSLAGLFNFRDDYVGQFREKLDSLATTMAWEVNRIHSQGAGLQKFTNVLGTYGVSDENEPLGDLTAGLFYGDKLQEGNLTIWQFQNGVGTPFQLGFDPDNHSLEDIRSAIDGIAGISANITGNKQLEISADNSGETFAFGSDSTGLLAALGINTFFQGDDARSFSMNQTVFNNLDFINAGHVNGAGEINPGDNSIAKDLAALQYAKVGFNTSFEGSTSQTISEYYNSLVGNVGAATANARFNFNYHKSLATDLNNRQEEISGVNLDEEMSNLIKFQHSYSAAAKLISTADQMFQTILSMK
jgi:flagellar hook-associated protein 1